jgi:hypothetical protein
VSGPDRTTSARPRVAGDGCSYGLSAYYTAIAFHVTMEVAGKGGGSMKPIRTPEKHSAALGKHGKRYAKQRVKFQGVAKQKARGRYVRHRKPAESDPRFISWMD